MTTGVGFQSHSPPSIFKTKVNTENLNDFSYIVGVGLLMVFYISVGCYAMICSAEVFRAPTKAWIENWGIVNLVLFTIGGSIYWYSNYNVGAAQIIAQNASDGNIIPDDKSDVPSRRWILQMVCILWSIIVAIICLAMFAKKADEQTPYESDNIIFYMGVVTLILSVFPITQAMFLLYMATDEPAPGNSLSWSKRIMLGYTFFVCATVFSSFLSGYFVQRDTAFQSWAPQYGFAGEAQWFLVSDKNVSVTYTDVNSQIQTLTWSAVEPIPSNAIRSLKVQTGNRLYEDSYSINWEVFLKNKSVTETNYTAVITALRNNTNTIPLKLVLGLKVIQDNLIEKTPKTLTIAWNKQKLSAYHALSYASQPTWNDLTDNFGDNIVLVDLRSNDIPWLCFHQKLTIEPSAPYNTPFAVDTINFTAKY